MKVLGPIIAVFLLGIMLMLACMQDSIVKTGLLGASGGGGGASSHRGLFGQGSQNRDKSENGDGEFYVPGMNLEMGEGLNYLAILEAVLKDPGKGDKWKKILMQGYVDSYQGKFNDFTNHAPPMLFAASHGNETSYDMFAKDKIMAGQVKLEDVNYTYVGSNGGYSIGSGSAIWKDANGDGWPDGPFQVEQGSQSDHSDWKSKLSKTGYYDVYSFPDNSNSVAAKYNEVATDFSGLGLSEVEMSAAAGSFHNRGNTHWQAYGTPYANTTAWDNCITEEGKKNVTKEKAEVYKVLCKAFTKYGIPVSKPLYDRAGGENVNQNCRTLAMVLLLKEGWFIDPDSEVRTKLQGGLQTFYKMSENNPIKKLFPEWTTAEAAMSAIESTYTKPIHEALGISSAEADKRYGTSGGSYMQSAKYKGGSYLYIYYPGIEKRPGIYKAGDDVNLVKCYDMVNVGYILECGPVAEAIYIKFALDAGCPDQIDGQVVDPTNPKVFYAKKTGGFNPQYGGSLGNLDEVLKLLGIEKSSLKGMSYKVLMEVYKDGGTPYQYGGHTAPFTANSGWLKSYDGTTSSAFGPIDKYIGRHQTDCSSWASIGANLGDFSGAGGQVKKNRQTGDWHPDVGKAYKNTVDGVEVDTTLLQVSKSGSILTSYSDSEKQYLSNWVGTLNPGDLLSCGGPGTSGHAVTYVGQNNTGASVTIPAELNFGTPLTVPAGEGVVLSTGTTKHVAWFETAHDNRQFRAYRLKCNQ